MIYSNGVLTRTFCQTHNVEILWSPDSRCLTVQGLGVKLHMHETWIWDRVAEGWKEADFLIFIAAGIQVARSHA